jgi:serine/threonine protein kinase/predicted ATPase
MPASSATDRLIGRRIAQYRIDAVLGKGGMGTVYRAYDLKLERPVALKSVRPGRSARGLDQFLKEVRTVSNLNDPNIVTIHGFETVDDGRFIVMEFVEGLTLRALSDVAITRTRLSVDEVVGIAMQMASALRVAHAAGIIHRDIKPENVMVREQDRLVKLLDFGLARLLPRAIVRSTADARPPVKAHAQSNIRTSARTRVTATGNTTRWFGTPAYMSPEQIQGRRLTGASDIFAFGVVLYELLTGTHPFGGRGHAATMTHIVERKPKPPRSLNADIPEPLSKLVLTMLGKTPASRPDARTVFDTLSHMRRRVAPRPDGAHIVGRQKHLESALDHFARFPECVLVCVLGEAGAGKTTLVEELLGQTARTGDDPEHPSWLVLRGRCEQLLAGAEAYLPVVEVLHSLLRSDRDGSIAALLKERAPGWYLQVTAGAPAAVTDQRPASPQSMNREFFDFLSALRGDRSLVLFLDDVHWADVSTVYLLDYLTTRADSLRLFTIVTARPEALDEAHPFRDVTRKLAAKDRAQELMLDLLSPDDVRQYIDLEFPKHRFPRKFVRLIHSRTEGNPLFMVDLLRDLRARGVLTQQHASWVVRPVSDLELPKRIESLIDQKVLALDGIDRSLLSWAAVQGYEFDSAVLARVSDARDTNVEERLEVLERRHALIRRVGNEDLPGGVTAKYRFTHVLYQNALEERLRRTPSRYAEVSLAVANALTAVYGSQRKTVASLLARLFEAARDFSQAAEHFHIAAENAAQVSAHYEASALLQRGLELLQRLPADTSRDQRELAMQLALGGSLMALAGFGADGVREAYTRAKQLCESLGNPEPHMQMVLRGLWGYHLVRAEYPAARELAYSLHSLAKRANNHALLVEGNHAIAFTLCHMGELTTAVGYRREAIRLHAERPGMDYGFPFALDPGVGCGVEYAMDLWLLGFPDQAREQARRSRELAERLGHPYSHGFALMFSGVIHEFCGEVDKTMEHAEQGIRLAREHGLREVQGWSMLRKGWAIAMSGEYDEGITLQRTVLKRQRELGSEVARPHFLGALAQSMIEATRYAEALATVEEALDTVQRTGARYYYAELLRLRGECALAMGEPAARAEDLFWQAREIARGQEAKSFELRAAISLARFLATSDKSAEGRSGLAEVYNWFQEGFDTEDLREARELLAGLS